jgi:hypothetical protein
VDSISSDVRVMSGGLQPNSALGHKPLFPEFGPYLLCQHERTFSPACGEQSAIERHSLPKQRCIGQRRRTARNITPWRAADEDRHYCFTVAL